VGGGAPGKNVIEKLQLLAPKLTGNEIAPAFIGVPAPVRTMV
jgi:hypothetical protein